MVLGSILAGLGELLLLAATALMILSNMSQLTGNVVARNIYYVRVNAANIGTSLSNTTTTTDSLFAPDQAAETATGAGLKINYYWGLYNYCGGEGVGGDRSCSDSEVGFRWEPLAALEADASSTFSSEIEAAFPDDARVADSDRLGLLSRVANIILLVGTILTGLAFLTGFLAQRLCFAFAALQSLGAAACLAVGAAIYTAIIYQTRSSIPEGVELIVEYGNALWMTWGAFAAVTIAIVPMLLACCVGRNKY